LNILVTGGNGFIGFNLIKKLLTEGHSVVSLDDLSIGSKEYEVSGCKYFYSDITSLWSFDNFSFDICYHLAALSRIQPSFENPMRTFTVNVEGCQIVAEWARINKVKVIYSGSSSKWSNSFLSPYANSKKIGEDIFKMYKTVYDCDFEICRFYNVYGPSEFIDGKWAAVIGSWRGLIRQGKPIIIVGDGEQKRDFTHVDDIVDGLYMIAIKNERHDDAWELGSGVNYSINEVFEFFKKRYNNIKKVHVLNQHGNYKETIRKNNDALDRLGWFPKKKLEDYILNLQDNCK
jgi:UDP-glucose 4-epimerase